MEPIPATTETIPTVDPRLQKITKRMQILLQNEVVHDFVCQRYRSTEDFLQATTHSLHEVVTALPDDYEIDTFARVTTTGSYKGKMLLNFFVSSKEVYGRVSQIATDTQDMEERETVYQQNNWHAGHFSISLGEEGNFCVGIIGGVSSKTKAEVDNSSVTEEIKDVILPTPLRRIDGARFSLAKSFFRFSEELITQLSKRNNQHAVIITTSVSEDGARVFLKSGFIPITSSIFNDRSLLEGTITGDFTKTQTFHDFRDGYIKLLLEN